MYRIGTLLSAVLKELSVMGYCPAEFYERPAHEQEVINGIHRENLLKSQYDNNLKGKEEANV